MTLRLTRQSRYARHHLRSLLRSTTWATTEVERMTQFDEGGSIAFRVRFAQTTDDGRLPGGWVDVWIAGVASMPRDSTSDGLIAIDGVRTTWRGARLLLRPALRLAVHLRRPQDSAVVRRHRELMVELLTKRIRGPVSEDEEERLSVAMNDCRRQMSDEEEREVDLLSKALRELDAK